ncbi:DUF6338 family protein [Streptomyces sp. NPDC050433]|uniref:DUF6338 family protein n=1 Tax=unclassified Streptomyces TaxID=2593676 RepID=UPI003413CA83
MGQAPSTVLQVALLVLVVLPGITYQFLRERWRGPVPREADLGQRVLRAVVASVVLDALYVAVAGPELLDLVGGENRDRWHGLAQQPRLAGIVGLILFAMLPAAAAGAVSWWERRQLRGRYRSTPTAWDHLFRDRGPCYIRVRLRDGTWAGGRYAPDSYTTSYPQPAELYLEESWRMGADGSFAEPVTRSAGLYVRAADFDVLELLHEDASAGAPTAAEPIPRD